MSVAACVTGGARGWNISYGSRVWLAPRQYSSVFGWGVEPRMAGRVRGSWAHCWVLREQPACRGVASYGPGRSVEPLAAAPLGVGVGRRRLLVGDRSLFENCTVDASIF